MEATITRQFSTALHAAKGAAVTMLFGASCMALMPSISNAQTRDQVPLRALGCDQHLKTAMNNVTDTKFLLIKQFRQGEPLVLTESSGSGDSNAAVEGASNAEPPTAAIDLCLVKLLVGPGNPGPEGAPSTSAGIGMEILLPANDHWNERIRAYGNSGWSGTPQANPSVVASDDLHAAAAAKGFVVATSDNGHAGSPINGSFAMNPDGSINTKGWQDFSERSLHELAEKTKLLTNYFYGRAYRYAYWDGFSTGGRQGLKLAQAFPNDFDGILVGSPAINWSRYHTAGLYAQVAMYQDLGYIIAADKLTLVSNASIEACGGGELGFLIDPLSCRYDPSLDTSILCHEVSGKSETTGSGSSQACLSLAEAKVINKAWYGQTIDGTAPEPASDNGNVNVLSDSNRLWFGWARGTDLKSSPVGGAPGLILAADQTTLAMRKPELGSQMFVNATGHGESRWRESLDYAKLAKAQTLGLWLQSQFSHINTDSPDLSKFARSHRKIVMYQGLADEYIPPQGAINYYERTMATMGGANNVKSFFRLYLIPGFTHSGRSEGQPFVPVPQPSSGRDEMFNALQAWVEHGKSPEEIVVKSGDLRSSLPLCVYPKKPTFHGAKSVHDASSYSCL